MSVSPITSMPSAPVSVEPQKAPAVPSSVPTNTPSAPTPAATVSISSAGHAASSADVDHDGDSH